MAEDLAIDVGIPKDSDEFDMFVSCIENILEYGCGYGDEFTEDILEKCKQSELDIAKKVIAELEKPRARYRTSKLKWWQEYVPKQNTKNYRTRNVQTKSNNHRQKRPMSPVCRPRNKKRPMSPLFRPRNRKRPMSPLFENRHKRSRKYRDRSNSIDYERDVPQRSSNKRSRYTIVEDRLPSAVPEWPGRPQSPRRSNKRRRYNRRN